jgi:hypothetical protein
LTGIEDEIDAEQATEKNRKEGDREEEREGGDKVEKEEKEKETGGRGDGEGEKPKDTREDKTSERQHKTQQHTNKKKKANRAILMNNEPKINMKASETIQGKD